MERIGFYAGSFDPFTNGHLQIVKKATKIFDKVIVGIAYNSEKEIRINKEKMKEAIEKTIKQLNIQNVQVTLYTGLTAEEAKKNGANILVRGLRNGTDYQYEEIFGLDSCYFRAGDLGYLSSSLVMELWNNGADISRIYSRGGFENSKKIEV